MLRVTVRRRARSAATLSPAVPTIMLMSSSFKRVSIDDGDDLVASGKEPAVDYLFFIQ
jgi:hypothetical protein